MVRSRNKHCTGETTRGGHRSDRSHDTGHEQRRARGDARAVADDVAAELGIGTVFAEVLPEDKASRIEEVRRRAERVAMVGDDVNDAPALLWQVRIRARVEASWRSRPSRLRSSRGGSCR
ncbi:MAG: HAD family hydrolase, partial [Acidobacteria bacterium]